MEYYCDSSDGGIPSEGDIGADFPDICTKRTMVMVYKPKILSVDLEACKTVEDVINTIRSHSDHETRSVDVFDYVLGAGLIPGHAFTEQDLLNLGRDWSKVKCQALNILPQVCQDYSVRIVDPRPQGTSGRRPSFDLLVNHEDTVADLKKRIQDETGIATASQRLHFGKNDLLPSDHLLAHAIGRGSQIHMRVESWLYFRFHEMSVWVDAKPDTPLYMILVRFAKQKDTSLSSLRFMIYHASGVVNSKSMRWLPDRRKLFDAEDVVGTVEGNGLVHGDQIQVFEVNDRPRYKRKRNITSDAIEARMNDDDFPEASASWIPEAEWAGSRQTTVIPEMGSTDGLISPGIFDGREKGMVFRTPVRSAFSAQSGWEVNSNT